MSLRITTRGGDLGSTSTVIYKETHGESLLQRGPGPPVLNANGGRYSLLPRWAPPMENSTPIKPVILARFHWPLRISTDSSSNP